jgi:hypothetical protein
VTPRPLTVLHLVANRWWTGSAEPVTRLVLALRARGHRALLALAGGDRFEVKAREAGVEPLEGLRLDVKSGPLAIVETRGIFARSWRGRGWTSCTRITATTTGSGGGAGAARRW